MKCLSIFPSSAYRPTNNASPLAVIKLYELQFSIEIHSLKFNYQRHISNLCMY